MKRKDKRIIWYLMFILALITFVGSSFSIFNTALSISGTSEELQKTPYIEAPVFGYLQCSPESQYTTNNIGFDGNVVTITCAGDSNVGTLLGVNDGCDVTLNAPTKTTILKRDYAYRIKTTGDSTWAKQGSVNGGILGYHGEQLILPLSRSGVMEIAYGGAFFDNPLNEGQTYRVSGNRFTLKDYNIYSSTTGQKLSNARSGNCILEDNFYKSKKITYSDPAIKELQGENKQFDFVNLNCPYCTYTYFAGFSPVPNFDQKIETYENKQVYCMNNALYKTLQITSNGYTYNIVNYESSGYIKPVPCCNGDEKPGYICSNHIWTKQEDAQCDINKGIFCPQSVFQPYGEKQYKRYNCENNQCIKEVIDVKCNDNSDCDVSKNEVCVKEDNPIENFCVSGGGGAGSGGSTIIKKDTDLTIPIILIVASLIIAAILISKKKSMTGTGVGF